MVPTVVRGSAPGVMSVTESRLATIRPWKDTPTGDRSPTSQERDETRELSYFTISMDTPVSPQKAEHLDSERAGSDCEQSFSATRDAGGLSRVSREDRVVVLDTGATAILVRFRRRERCN